MRLISWNVNGLRAAVRKGFLEKLKELNPDCICLQEIKLSEGQLELDLPEYKQFYNYAQRKGYSGTAIFTKIEPISVSYGLGLPEHDSEGRVITLEFEDFYLVTCYTPNSKRELLRLEYRQLWDKLFLEYLKNLENKKPVVACGDLNVAHKEIDLFNPKQNRRNAGFTDEERSGFQNFVDNGFIDTFRYFYPDKEMAYTWWSNFAKSRERNIGWRIDYFITSKSLEDRLKDAIIYDQVMGSDHCPIELELK